MKGVNKVQSHRSVFVKVSPDVPCSYLVNEIHTIDGEILHLHVAGLNYIGCHRSEVD